MVSESVGTEPSLVLTIGLSELVCAGVVGVPPESSFGEADGCVVEPAAMVCVSPLRCNATAEIITENSARTSAMPAVPSASQVVRSRFPD